MKREPVTVPLKRIRSLGQEHWPSKQGVSAGSIGRASKNPAVCWYHITEPEKVGINSLTDMVFREGPLLN